MSILPTLPEDQEDPSGSLQKINSIMLPDNNNFSVDSCSVATSLTPFPRLIDSKMSNGDASPSKNTVRSLKPNDNWYSLENHLKNIFKVTVKPEDPEKIREDRLQYQRKVILESSDKQLANSPLKKKLAEDMFTSRDERFKRSQDRKKLIEKTIQRIKQTDHIKPIITEKTRRSSMNVKNNNKNILQSCFSPNQSTFLTSSYVHDASTNLPTGSHLLSSPGDISQHRNLQSLDRLGKEAVVVMSEEKRKDFISQFERIKPKKPMFNVKVDYWDFDGFYDKFEFSSPSLSNGVKRVRMNPRNASMNNGAYLEDKKERSSSIMEQKQQAANVFKLIRPISNEVRSLKQHIQHPQGDKLLEKYDYNKKAKKIQMERQGSDSLIAQIQINMLKSEMDKKNQSFKEANIRKKVHSILKLDDSVLSPYKVPSNNEKEEFYQLSGNSVKAALSKFRHYSPFERDTFFPVRNAQKNPYFRVYADGQQKLINKYLSQGVNEERFFYQQEHDPFINDPENYRVFDVVGSTYMKPIPPLEFAHKRRCAKDQSQLEREVNMAQQAFAASQAEEENKPLDIVSDSGESQI